MNALRAVLYLIVPLLPLLMPFDAVSAPDENRRCLGCHGSPGLSLAFLDGDSLKTSLDPQSLQQSVHGSLCCSDCHPDFLNQNHPKRTFRNRLQYQVKSSLVCRRCHPDQQIRKHDIHQNLLREERRGNAPVCVNCHGAHSIERVSGRTAFKNEEQYCLRCHRGNRSMTFGSAETMSLAVDVGRMHESVHAKLSCSDCHFGFSSEEHPERQFKTRRDFVLASSESCRRCHFDKYTKTLESIHYTLLSQGRLDAPVCTDCHGAHDIARIGKERSASAKRCQRCHRKEYDVYASSVHGNALINEHNQDVPVCADCHTAHDIQNPFSMDYRERIPEMCSNCHARKEIVGKYGLSTDVVKTYLADFHGMTLGLYRKQKGDSFKPARPIAVCTDCHGTHGITSTTGPEATTVKKNLVSRCRKCHSNATENFPDAWLSHYEPSLKRAPLVFAVMVMYKLFIPLFVIGLILQILLHIWRYAVNR
jgi:predicted CXXCH cytochrome family protein